MARNKMMKKIFYVLTLGLLLLGLLSFPATVGKAQTPVPGTAPALPENVVTFSQLKLQDTTLLGPYDSMLVRFATPPNWKLTNKASIELTLNPTYSSSKTAEATYGATLQVYFNNKLQTNIPLNWTGEKTVVVPIDPQELAAASQDGRHTLYLFLDASIDCDKDHQTSLIVGKTSQFLLDHELTPPATDLRLLPRPLYQEGAFAINPGALVVPNQPTASELRAALIVSAGFGLSTNGRLTLPVLPASQVTPELQKSTNLIFVGKPGGFEALKSAKLPAPVAGTSFSAPGAIPEDGIVQMAVSPWSDAHVILVVGGGTDAAVVKAAQGVSSGALRVSSTPDLAVVTEVKDAINQTSVNEDRTFSSLGYPVLRLAGIGFNSEEIRFFVPFGQTTTNEAYLDLTLTHTPLMNFNRSSLNVTLNDLTIGGAKLSAETTNTTTTRISIPTYALRPGFNRLTIDANLIPNDVCFDFSQDALWINVDPGSLLHIPLLPATYSVGLAQNLSSYPYTFADSPTLANVAFVLPAKDPAAWNIAAKIATDLGSRAYGPIIDLTALFGDAVPEDVRKSHDLLIVGKPTDLPIMSAMGDALPAPFPSGSNIATERNMSVSYRLPENVSLGYLQLLAAPWDTSRTVLGVLGTNEQGLQWAGDALTISQKRGRLAGNFAVTTDQQILSTDSRYLVGAGNLAATAAPQPAAMTTVVPNTLPQPAAQKPTLLNSSVWVLPAIIGVSLLILIILAIVLTTSRRRS